MFDGIFTGLFKMLWDLFKWVFLAVGVIIVVFLLFYMSWYCYFYFVKHMRVKRRKVPPVSDHYINPGSIFKRLFMDFPRQLVLDKFRKNPDAFDTFGVHIFCGEQGSGKSIAMMHFIKMCKERNPLCKIASNINIQDQDDQISDWTDILTTNNGWRGQVVVLDEIQNWFSSNESKDFPPEMLTEVTQQRKQRKVIVGTSQVFTRMSKPIREQITYLYKPFTVAGCLTFVRVYRCQINDDGQVDKMRMQRMYFFVHDDDLRNCYDTYAKVERQAIVGFQERSSQLRKNDDVVVPDFSKLQEFYKNSKKTG